MRQLRLHERLLVGTALITGPNAGRGVAAAATHTRRRRALHGLCTALAREPRVVAFAWELISERGARDRLARVTAVFTFVSHIVDAGPSGAAAARLGPLQPLLAFREGPAVLLCALLKALGEHARLERTREMAFVRLALDPEDVSRLPPHADLLHDREALEIPLDPRRARTPVGFLPSSVRDALRLRRASAR